MTKSRVFLILSLSFIGGAFACSFLNVLSVSFVLLVLSIIIASIFFKNKKALVFSGAILFFALGLWRTGQKLDILNNLLFEQKEFSGEARVAKEPIQKENYQQITAEISLGSEASKSRILINASQYLDINYGDELTVNCLLKVPEDKDEFNYRMYLAKEKIYYICQGAKIEKTGENSGNKFYGAVLKLKNKMQENINGIIPYPQSALANGLIFGGSSELPKQLKDNFSKTGMTHIVAVSGYNVSIIAEYLIWFFIFIGLWRKQAFWAAVLGIILFVAMTGFSSSAVRAGVMGTLLIWAAKNGRLANSWNAIIFAGAIMLLINPLLLRWDIGFQLSFLATIGIIALSPLWEKYLIKKHKAFGFTEIFFLTLSAQIFVLPVILYSFHTLSLVSLAANLLILLIIPISMLLVFLSGLMELFFHWLALPFAWLAFLPLKYETWAIDSLASLNRSSVEIKNFLWWHAAVWYAALALLMYHINRRQKIKLAKRAGSLANKENFFYAE